MPQIPTLRRSPSLRAEAGPFGAFALGVLLGFALVWSSVANARPAPAIALMKASAVAVVSAPLEAQQPATPLDSEAPESGEGSIETGDDLSSFDDFAYHTRVDWGCTAKLNREVDRGASLGGRAASRLEDNRSDKPPRG